MAKRRPAKKKRSKYQLFDSLRPEEYAALEKDIVARGVQVAVEVDENGNVLDGYNRVEIAERHGLKYKTVIRRFKTEGEKREHVLKLNLVRRHLAPYQWGAAFKKLLNERGIKRGKPGPKLPKSTDTESVSASVKIGDLAAELGVDERTAYNRLKAADEVEAAPAKVRNEIDTTDVPASTIIKKHKAEKRKWGTKKKEDHARRQASAKKGKPWKVTQQQDAVACDVVITDPPYGILDEAWEPEQLETFTREWLQRWAQCGARFITSFWSQRYLWDGRRWFDECLAGYAFQQLLVWHYANNKSPQNRMGFKQTWEPILFYRLTDSDREIGVGGAEWGEDLHDFDCHVAAVPQTNFTDANMKQHPAQKPVSVMRWLVNALTQPGELVCDPFCGSGTTGIAAVELGRRFHGIEKSRDYLKVANGRIACYGKK